MPFRRTVKAGDDMKMLFFSSDGTEVELVGKEFSHAGIACEVRKGPCPPKHLQVPRQAELWIHNDRDCHRALMLCVQLGIGFSKRPPRASLLEDIEGPPIDQAPEQAPEELPQRGERVLKVNGVNGRH